MYCDGPLSDKELRHHIILLEDDDKSFEKIVEIDKGCLKEDD
jgi:hypothetical protein